MFIEKLQIVVIVLVILMVVLLAALLAETTVVDVGRRKLFTKDDTTIDTFVFTPEANNLQNNIILTKSISPIDESYLNEITFLGDSRFEGLINYGISQEHIFAKSGLNHRQALTLDFVQLANGDKVTLVEALQQMDTDILLMNFGINGAGWFSTTEFLDNYNALLDLIIENTDDIIIVVQSILPITYGFETGETGFPNTRVDELNDYILEICKERNLYYLDSSIVMKDENNALKSNYSSDGLHFNSQGYEELLQHILEYTIYK